MIKNLLLQPGNLKTMLKTKVKASSLSNLTDARYFAAFEVNWLGFNLSAGDADYCPPQTAAEIREWVDGVEIVAEFGIEDLDEIRPALDLIRPDGVQVGMFASSATIMALSREAQVFQEIVPDLPFNGRDLQILMDQNAAFVRYFLLNFDKAGISWQDIRNGHPFGPEVLQGICEHYPVLLGLAMSPDDALEALSQLPAQGLSIRGGSEEKTGFKSFDELDPLLEALSLP